MHATELLITSKTNDQPFSLVSAEHFTTQTGQPVDPQTILDQPNLSLYCLDHANRRALFVETPTGIDLFQSPFYFIAQYEAATRLIAVPYDTLHALAQQVEVAQQNIILFYSTGRCGSTLFSHVLNTNPTIASYAEPDVFTQLLYMRTSGQTDDAETTALLRSCTLLMSANAQRQGYRYFAFKFRSYVLSVSDLLYRALPDAKVLFMYRNAVTWARSFSRAFGVPNDQLLIELLNSGWRYLIPGVNAHLMHTPTIGWGNYLAHMWVSTMQDIQRLQAQNAPVTTIRFETLKAAPVKTIQAAFTQLGLSLPDSAQLASVLAKDSQAGTAGAQDKQNPARVLTDIDKRKLVQAIHDLDNTLSPGTLL